jgi:hypothetical protein
VSVILLSTAYLPPVSFFSKINASEGTQLLFEQHEHFVKQSYRNRCCILSANGILPLSVPILHGKSAHVPIKEVLISYDFGWQKIHWKSIESGYRCSPFFEFYEDSLLPYYTKKHKYLFDLNQELLEVFLKLLKIQKTISYTNSYEKLYTTGQDLRTYFHPRQLNDPAFSAQGKVYSQVFGSRFGFVSNLSILDLLFNVGPQAPDILLHSFCQ